MSIHSLCPNVDVKQSDLLNKAFSRAYVIGPRFSFAVHDFEFWQTSTATRCIFVRARNRVLK